MSKYQSHKQAQLLTWDEQHHGQGLQTALIDTN
jgi:hypothetical protein